MNDCFLGRLLPDDGYQRQARGPYTEGLIRLAHGFLSSAVESGLQR
jgi:hypothetical protein